MLEHLHKMTGAGWLSSFLSEQLPLGGRRCKQQASIFSEVTCKVTAPHRTAVHRYTWRSTVASEENFASICSLST
jgi:hypothetical protein